jgi:hypothetical protein
MQEENMLRLIKCAVLILALPCAHAVADADMAIMPTEALQTSYRDIRDKLHLQAEASVTSSTKAVMSEFGTKVACGAKMESADLTVTLDTNSGRPLFILVHPNAVSEVSAGNKPFRDDREALGAAEAFVRELGWSIETNTHLIHKEYDPGKRQWRFAWQRHLAGYPFPEETISTSIDAASRHLSSFRCTISERGCATVPSLSNTDAQQIAATNALGIAMGLVGQDYGVRGVRGNGLQVVYPNGRYATYGKRTALTEVAPSPQLVYWFDVAFEYRGTDTLHRAVAPISVWVDAVSGEVVGGL